MEKSEIWGTRQVMEYLGCGRKKATAIMNMPGCPILSRKKNMNFCVRPEAFKRWWNREI